METFQELFEAYGADYRETMRRFMNKEAMYIRFLDMLFQDTSLEKLGRALDSGDMTGAFEAAHTLKGVSANLGLTPLYEAVCAIVEPLRFGTPFDAEQLFEKIQSEFKRVDLLRSSLKGEG